MNAAAIIAEARRAAGLDQFDSESFREGLDIIARHLPRDRSLTDAGRGAIVQMAIALLRNRLLVADYARRHPEVLERAIARPVVILGMPRTGTTMASYLLGLDPDRRSLLYWEACNCVPPARAGQLTTDPRCLAMKQQYDSAFLTSPEIHLEQPDLPTECIFVLAHDFKSILWQASVRSAEYEDWLLKTDMHSAYAYHKLQLQVMQHHTRGIWSLKAPAHALSIPVLKHFYPDARIIWAHRDPYKAMASTCSVISKSRGGLGQVDESSIGPAGIETFSQHLQRAMAYDIGSGSNTIHHLHYAEMMRDPLAQMRKLYDWLGDALSPKLEAAMREWIGANPQGKFGVHAYGLERFGLTVEMLRPHFEPYVSRYHVEPEA
jgi:hypothetical protein